MERKRWAAIKQLLWAAFFWAVVLGLPSEALAAVPQAYTIGLLGIDYKVQSASDMNLANYVDMRDKRDPMVYAQEVFTDVMTGELARIRSLDPRDVSEQTLRAIMDEKMLQSALGDPATASKGTLRIVPQLIMDEIMLQLAAGNPSIAVKLFPVKLDYLIYGKIVNFTVSHRESMGSNNISVEAELAVRIMDAGSGKVVFVGTGKGVASTHDVSLGNANREKISEERWREALEQALLMIADKIQDAV